MWGRWPHIFCCYTSRFDVNETLEELVTRELDALGFDLVELKAGGTRGRPSLDVRIDRRDGTLVTIDDTARAALALRDAPFEDVTLGDRYGIEVSSPGVERPLTRAADWRRFAGQKAKVLSDAVGGREEVEIVGVEGEPGSELVVVKMKGKKGEVRRIPLAEVKEARLAFHW
jgi:ribosome maturation factor RimP